MWQYLYICTAGTLVPAVQMFPAPGLTLVTVNNIHVTPIDKVEYLYYFIKKNRPLWVVCGAVFMFDNNKIIYCSAVDNSTQRLVWTKCSKMKPARCVALFNTLGFVWTLVKWWQTRVEVWVQFLIEYCGEHKSYQWLNTVWLKNAVFHESWKSCL